MTITIKDAINLHKCLAQIELDNVSDDNQHDAFYDDIEIKYHRKDGFNFIVDDVIIWGVRSQKAKELLQEYFNEDYIV